MLVQAPASAWRWIDPQTRCVAICLFFPRERSVTGVRMRPHGLVSRRGMLNAGATQIRSSSFSAQSLLSPLPTAAIERNSHRRTSSYRRKRATATVARDRRLQMDRIWLSENIQERRRRRRRRRPRMCNRRVEVVVLSTCHPIRS